MIVQRRREDMASAAVGDEIQRACPVRPGQAMGVGGSPS
jgi:hypothetical protein